MFFSKKIVNPVFLYFNTYSAEADTKFSINFFYIFQDIIEMLWIFFILPMRSILQEGLSQGCEKFLSSSALPSINLLYFVIS